MGLMFLKKLSLLFLLISGSLLPTSSADDTMTVKKKVTLSVFNAHAGGRSKFMRDLAEDLKATKEGTPRKPVNKEEVSIIQERILRDNTRDYGRYDPSPALSKPPFKLIPN